MKYWIKQLERETEYLKTAIEIESYEGIKYRTNSIIELMKLIKAEVKELETYE